jgi:hypothetical protein
MDLPSLFVFSPIPNGILGNLEIMPSKLGLDQDVVAYLEDTLLISTTAAPNEYYRIFRSITPTEQLNRGRLTRRAKAEMLLLQDEGFSIVEDTKSEEQLASSPGVGSISLEGLKIADEGSTEVEETANAPDTPDSVLNHPASVPAIRKIAKEDWTDGIGKAPMASRH